MHQLIRFRLLVILTGIVFLSGCAKPLEIRYFSSPSGATIAYNYKGDKFTSVTPATLKYVDVTDRGGCNNLTVPTVTWPDGVTIPPKMTTLCSKEYIFYKPAPLSSASKVSPPPVKSNSIASDDTYFKNLDTERLCRVIQIGKPQDVEGARKELNNRSAVCNTANPVKEEVKPAPVVPYTPPIPVNTQPPAGNSNPTPKIPPKPALESPMEIKRQKCLRLGIAPGSLDFQQCMQ
jgi:hypothetical protein